MIHNCEHFELVFVKVMCEYGIGEWLGYSRKFQAFNLLN